MAISALTMFIQKEHGIEPKEKPAKTPEGVVKNKIKYLFRKYKCWHFMPVSSGYSRSGVPDFIACCNGYFIAVEAKSNKTSHPVTKLQQQEIGKIQTAGGIALVVDEENLTELEQILKTISKKEN